MWASTLLYKKGNAMNDPAMVKWLMAGLLIVGMLVLVLVLMVTSRGSKNSATLHRYSRKQRKGDIQRQQKQAKLLRSRMNTDQIVEDLNDVFGQEP